MGVTFCPTCTYNKENNAIMGKPRLKAKVETIFKVHHFDLEKFVEEIYGGSFELPAIEETHNYSLIECSVPNTSALRDEEAEKQIRQGKYPKYCTGIVLKLLHEDGYIPSGKYIVDVSW